MLGGAAAIALIVVILGLDLAGSPTPKYVGVITATPFFAAAFASPRVVALVGMFGTAGAYWYGIHLGQQDTSAQWIRLGAIVLATLIAMTVAYIREKRERRLAALIRVAEVAQQTILHPIPPQVGDFRCAVGYVSAATEARIGGDLYEVVPTIWGTRAIIGDVRGKGLEAVRLASVVLGAFRLIAHDRNDLCDIARDLDLAVARAAGPEDFVTAIIVELDESGNLHVVNCGHPSPFLYEHGTLTELSPTRPTLPLGLGSSPQISTYRLSHDARLLLFTDGLIEARSPDSSMFPASEHSSIAMAGEFPEDIIASLEDALLRHVHGRLDDDVAMLVLMPAAKAAGDISVSEMSHEANGFCPATFAAD